MGFMDKVKEAARQVGDKAQEGMKAGQEKFDDVKTNRRISELTHDLGALVLRQHTEGAQAGDDAEIERLVGEITEAKSQLQAAPPPEPEWPAAPADAATPSAPPPPPPGAATPPPPPPPPAGAATPPPPPPPPGGASGGPA